MEDIGSYLQELQQLISLELNKLQRLEGEKLDRYKWFLRMKWEPSPIFYNTTNIVLTSAKDYKRLKGAYPKIDEILRLELKEFNCYLIAARYVNIGFLNEILDINQL